MNKLFKSIYEKHKIKKNKYTNQFDDSNIIAPNANIAYTKWGMYSTCNARANVVYTSIGNYSGIGPECIICPRTHLFDNFMIKDYVYQNYEHHYKLGDGPFEGYFVQIGSDVSIGSRVLIVPGVSVGNGAFVAMGSVLTKSVPPYAIVGGNPAKIIRYRFPKSIIQTLEDEKWYDWDIKKVMDNKERLQSIVSFNIETFKQQYWKTPKQFLM